MLSGAGDAIRTRDNLLGRQELCQLSYARSTCEPVGVRGLEPPTSASQTLRATGLRHTPSLIVYAKIDHRQSTAQGKRIL